jgi:putative SOS response-associated peptidase YedK
MVQTAFKKFVKKRGAIIDFVLFEKLYRMRFKDKKIKIPRGIDANFANPESPEEQRIKDMIDEWDALQRTEYEKELFKQTTRLNNADRVFADKPQKAEDDKRIATNKIAAAKKKLTELNEPLKPTEKSRIFPFQFAPVFVMEQSKLVVKPMRYHLRQFYQEPKIDRERDGLYNARRDNLDKYWKGLWGKQHAAVLITAFYENVSLHNFEHRELKVGEAPQNVVLEFNPKPETEMLLACLWDSWGKVEDEQFLSFAAITDEPPVEVSAAGHDRCVIPIQEKNLEAWLTPVGRDKSELSGILDERERPYYEHRKAA